MNTTSDVTKTARMILRTTPESIETIAAIGYKGSVTPGLTADEEFELRNAIQDEAKALVAAM